MAADTGREYDPLALGVIRQLLPTKLCLSNGGQDKSGMDSISPGELAGAKAKGVRGAGEESRRDGITPRHAVTNRGLHDGAATKIYVEPQRRETNPPVAR
jgi:hypothetical protein